jgi:hypothetical protein
VAGVVFKRWIIQQVVQCCEQPVEPINRLVAGVLAALCDFLLYID